MTLSSEAALPANMKPVLRDLVHELVVGNYAGLEADGRAGDRSAEVLRQAIADYGRTLTELPDEAFERKNALAYRLPSERARWAVEIALWTLEEGRSDLMLEATVQVASDGTSVEIEDIHVM